MMTLSEAKASHAIQQELSWLKEEADILDQMEHSGDSEETKAYFRGKKNAIAQEYSRLLYWMDEFEFNLERRKESSHAQKNQKAKP